jgi:hypothetical protein
MLMSVTVEFLQKTGSHKEHTALNILFSTQSRGPRTSGKGTLLIFCGDKIHSRNLLSLSTRNKQQSMNANINKPKEMTRRKWSSQIM